MLKTLEVTNFLLFEHTVFAFDTGLNAVSGETGAGKSLVARALGLALGGRGGQDVIRSGTNEARVRAEFAVDDNWTDAERTLADSAGTLVLERVVRRTGQGAMLVNGKAMPAGKVRETFAPMVDFAAQNESMRLADPVYQLQLLDAYAGLAGAAEEYRADFAAAAAVQRRITAGREERELVRIRLERAREEAAYLEKLAFDTRTDPQIEQTIHELSHSAAIVQAAGEAAALLEQGEQSPMDALAQAHRTVERLAAVSPGLRTAGEELEAALEAAGRALDALGGLAGGLDADPARLDALISRAEKLKAAAHRFECQVRDLPAAAERLAKEIDDLSCWDAGEDEARALLDKLLPPLAEKGSNLAAARRKKAADLARVVDRELASLGMPDAGFSVEFETLWNADMPLVALLDAGPDGPEEAAFFLRPNPGEAPSPIAGGASGGESSRAVLALKAALSEVYRPGLMFLDEIDAGVGARLGRELSVKLRALADSRQIIVITHLPQIAAAARRHLMVAKKVAGGRTTAGVRALEGNDRVAEIASMIDGHSATDITRRQALEMLQQE